MASSPPIIWRKTIEAKGWKIESRQIHGVPPVRSRVRDGDGVRSRIWTVVVTSSSVLEHLPLARFTTLTGADDKLAFAMAYHDVSWDVVRRMVESGVLAVPPALREGADDNVSMAGVCAVIDMHPGLLSELKKALGIK